VNRACRPTSSRNCIAFSALSHAIRTTSTPVATTLLEVPGGTPVWTVYTYDGLGRAVSIQQPDGASTTTYAYAEGNEDKRR